jgi:phospholipid/cholesterol/gamma-HCH transport system permease protein
METPPRIVLAPTADGGVGAVLRGMWTAAQLARPEHWQAVQAVLQAQTAQPTVQLWDLRELDRLDHTGAQLLWNHWGRHWPARVEMLPAQRAMLTRIAQYSVPAPQPDAWSLWAVVDDLGTRVLATLGHVRGLVRLVGQLALDTLRFVRAPAKAPWRDISGHLYRAGATALPITGLVGFLIGVVLAYLLSKQLRQFGADSFIVNILGLGLIRELGPMLAAILVAGRSGSAITAQIGVMRVTEELDAMRVLGIARGYRLVFPRALALGLALPLLAVWTITLALLGGMLAADMTLGITPAYFLTALPKVVDVANLWLAVGKSMLFGALIALVGCHFGLRVQPNTQSLGEGTTASVVTAITVVLVVDAIMAVVFRNVGI